MTKVLAKLLYDGKEIKTWMELPLSAEHLCFFDYFYDLICDGDFGISTDDFTEDKFEEDNIEILEIESEELDYLTPRMINSIDSLNEFVEWYMEELTDLETQIVDVLIQEENIPVDKEELMGFLENSIVYKNCYDMADVARQYVSIYDIFIDMPDHAMRLLEDYFDYEKYGNDLNYDCNFKDLGNGVFVEIREF